MNRICLVSLGCFAASLAALGEIAPGRRAECKEAAAALVAQMTPEEQLSQLMMDSPAIKRLGVERHHWWNEALHGVARAGQATVFPQSIGLGATFDEPLVHRMADVISTEARAKHNLFAAKGDRGIYKCLTLWSPNVNMFRDPRWGRGQETFGEDPHLSGVLGAAFVRGIQGDDPRFLKAAACAKHFAVHSGPEKLRHGFDVKVSQQDMAEYYLPAFKALVDAKVESVMGAYSAINGVPCCANKWLLTDLLRGEWGFEGHIVSDVGAVRDIATGHHFAKDRTEASKASIAAGLDLCSENTYNSLRIGVGELRVPKDEFRGNAEQVEQGTQDTGHGTEGIAIDSKTMIVPLTRLFTTRFLLGEFDKTPWDNLGAESVANEAHRAIALEAAEKSLVLIKNNGVLPLDAGKLRSVGVAGPRAFDELAILGNYYGYTANPVSCASGIIGEAGPGVSVTAEPDMQNSEVIVLCLGNTAEEEGEESKSAVSDGGDRAQYALADEQMEKLRAYRKKKGKKIVSVVFGGSPIDLKEICELSDAVIVAWYPGEQGGRVIARAIFGKTNNFGRLPITFPESYEDLPPMTDYSLAGRTYRYATKKPAFPFGYGLSYTTYSYSRPRISYLDTKIQVTVEVENTGERDGEEIVQLYIRAPKASNDRRLHHLEGFSRVALKVGEKKDVSFYIPREAFNVYDEDGKPSSPRGVSSVFVGGGQPGFAQTLEIKIPTMAKPLIPGDYSDPDVIRVGTNYYMVTSSFQMSPGVPVLRSCDLKNWTTVAHAVPDLMKFSPKYGPDRMQMYGKGIYAPSIREHNGKFYVYVPSVDEGIIVSVADKPEGPWRADWLKKADGTPWKEGRWTDPCPFWEDTGNGERVTGNGWIAMSALHRNWTGWLFKLSDDGMQLLDEGWCFSPYRSTEGHKIYKRGDWYYLFHIEFLKDGHGEGSYFLRSKDINGPYELKYVPLSIPGQGALVDDTDGRTWWIAQFNTPQEPIGRAPYICPVEWRDDWPEIGEPTDAFSGGSCEQAWQCNHVCEDGAWDFTSRPGWLRIKNGERVTGNGFWKTPNVACKRVIQYDDETIVSCDIDTSRLKDGEEAGLALFNGGVDYAICKGVRSGDVMHCEWRISGDRCRSNDGQDLTMRGAKYRGINWGLYTTGTADFSNCKEEPSR